MEFDEPKLFSDLIVKYRQRLDTVTFELERTLAQAEQKDQYIALLEARLEIRQNLQGEMGATGEAEIPTPSS